MKVGIMVWMVFLYRQNYKEKQMEIQTVKIQGQGYLLNGTMLVPKADGNREYELIKQWLTEGNTPEPEFTEEELNTKFENEFRRTRDSLLLTVVDHYQKPLVWESLTTEQQDKVRVYRQALLDSTINWILPEELVL